MIYIIDGIEEVFVRKEIKSFIKKNDSPILIDGNDKDFSINQILDACDSSCLFSETNLVLVNNPQFLIKKTNDDLLEPLYKYIKKPNYNCDLIFYTYENNFNKTLKAYKEIASNAEIKTFNPFNPYNFKSQCIGLIDHLKLNITKEAINKLISSSDNSYTDFVNNLAILRNYPDLIDSICIDKLCSFNLNDDIFDLVNSLANKDSVTSIKILHNLYDNNNSPFLIISTLSTQLRFLYQVDYLKSKGKTINQIAQELNAKEIRVELTLKKLNYLTYEQIIEILSKLSILDDLNKTDSSQSVEDRFDFFILRNFGGKYD